MARRRRSCESFSSCSWYCRCRPARARSAWQEDTDARHSDDRQYSICPIPFGFGRDLDDRRDKYPCNRRSRLLLPHDCTLHIMPHDREVDRRGNSDCLRHPARRWNADVASRRRRGHGERTFHRGLPACQQVGCPREVHEWEARQVGEPAEGLAASGRPDKAFQDYVTSSTRSFLETQE